MKQSIRMIFLLNSPVLTTFGTYQFDLVDVDKAKELVKNGFQSFIGHESTCQILSKLLEVNVPLSRTQYFQQPNEQALIFKLKTRPAEGVVLKSIEEIEQHGYEFGLLTRI